MPPSESTPVPGRRSRPSAFVEQLRGGASSLPLPGDAGLADVLRAAVLGGQVAPGTAIPVGAVAELYQVSPIPVREALHVLMGERLVDHLPNVGYRVARVTRQELRELYLVRGVLEAAALHAAVPSAAAERANARAALGRLDDAVEAGDVRAYHRHSRSFHLALVAPCRMSRLLHMLQAAWNVTEPVQPMQFLTDEERRVLHADHRLMYAAFADGDADRLVELSRRHGERLEHAVGGLPEDI
jgi:DNA-binding GntR family transcriptional regulator